MDVHEKLCGHFLIKELSTLWYSVPAFWMGNHKCYIQRLGGGYIAFVCLQGEKIWIPNLIERDKKAGLGAERVTRRGWSAGTGNKQAYKDMGDTDDYLNPQHPRIDGL